MRTKNLLLLKLTVLTVLATLLVGCGSTAPMLNPVHAQPQSSISMLEGHSGQMFFTGKQEFALLDFEFVRQGQTLEGVGRMTIVKDPKYDGADITVGHLTDIEDGRIIFVKDPDYDGVDVTVGRLTGTDDGQTHNFSIYFGPPYGRVSFQGTSGSDGFSGSHDGVLPLANVNTQNNESGVYQSQISSLTSESAPLTGRYTVTLDDGTTMNLNITQPASPDPNLPDVTGLSHAIVAWVGDPSAMQPMDAGGGTYLSGNFNLRVNPFDSQRYPFFSCLLFGTATSGKYIQFRGQDANIKQGTYTMKVGFD